MVQRIVFMSAALLVCLLGEVAGAAAQSCIIQTPRYSLKADTVDWTIKIASGKSCARGVRFGNVEIDAVSRFTAAIRSGDGRRARIPIYVQGEL
jgi:hypothetical protein